MRMILYMGDRVRDVMLGGCVSVNYDSGTFFLFVSNSLPPSGASGSEDPTGSYKPTTHSKAPIPTGSGGSIVSPYNRLVTSSCNSAKALGLLTNCTVQYLQRA